MRIRTGLACGGIALLLLPGCGSDAGGGGNAPPPAPAPTVTLAAAPTSVVVGASSVLTWSSTNATGCTASNGWSGARAASGSETIADIRATTNYTLTCSGAGGSSSPASATITAVPGATANAGPGRTVVAGAAVRLSGEASTDPQGDALQYTWTQTGGAAVALSGANTVSPTFTAPSVTADTALTFSLTVSDGSGVSAPATVTIDVAPLAANHVLVTGRVTYVRIPFYAQPSFGLDYAAPVSRPARGIVVVAQGAGTTTQLAVGETDSDGAFALSVPRNTMIEVRAVARMTRAAGVPLPRWDFSVVDADAGGPPYSYTDAAFSSSTGVTHDLGIPSGLGPTGTVTGTRASAPFAVLDTVYTTAQAIVGVAPTVEFPPLRLDWAADNPGGDTFFDGGAPQTIVLSANMAEDTDEFDPHVIAHEFGHYIEHNFSRADNIGGGHGIGDKLDIRVAFGEGFGYAFAAIALEDPVVRDSFVAPGCKNPPTNQCASTFNIETNPSRNPPGTPSGNFGCWCSESSVWSLLWDVYDGAADGSDNVALGLQPMWDVLVDAQRTTPEMTSLFTFMDALKKAQPASAAALDTLAGAQNTDPIADGLGSTESHVPTPVAAPAALPVYTAITTGVPVTVRSVDDAGHYNALGNHRFVRYVKSGPGTQTVSITSSGADPDAVVYLDGLFSRWSNGGGDESFDISTAGTYIFDVYECSNGCDDEQGTPGDYDVTVTIN